MSLDQLVAEAKQLSVEERLHLIQRLVESISQGMTSPRPCGSGLRYGAFRGQRTSNEEDFKQAEWHPTERDWNP